MRAMLKSNVVRVLIAKFLPASEAAKRLNEIEICKHEFMLVRKSDGAKIINRLFLTKHGFGNSPYKARMENKDIAYLINTILESESSQRVSFGKITK